MTGSPVKLLASNFTELRFTVLGLAQTKGSAKAFLPKGSRRPIITNDNPKAKAWAQRIAATAQAMLAPDGRQPFPDGPVALELWFYFPRPQKYCTRTFAGRAVPHVVRPDIDKVTRCAVDALTTVVWKDDAQVVDLVVRKRYCAVGELPRVEILVRRTAPMSENPGRPGS
jgi:Holliday junction resolvase RusA-like endonuclease